MRKLSEAETDTREEKKETRKGKRKRKRKEVGEERRQSKKFVELDDPEILQILVG